MTYPEGEPNVIDLGNHHFIRPVYTLLPRLDPGTPVVPQSDSEVEGLDWWHDCREAGGHWQEVHPGDPLVCALCGDSGQIKRGRWVKRTDG